MQQMTLIHPSIVAVVIIAEDTSSPPPSETHPHHPTLSYTHSTTVNLLPCTYYAIS
jgi:hypothetical protein